MIKLKSQWEIERPFNLLAWGHWFALGNLILALLLSFFYISASPLPSSFVGWFYLANNWLSHFAFLAIACFIVFIFPVITLFPYRRHIRGLSAAMASVLQMLLLMDVLAYRSLGYHLSSSSINQLREVEDVYLGIMGHGYWFFLLATFALILTYQMTLSNFTWKRIQKLQAIQYKNHIANTLLAAFIISHVTHLWADATLNSDIAKQRNLFPMSYPLTAKTLLAEYELIDLDEYNLSKARRLLLNPASYEAQLPKPLSCDITAKPNLNVKLIDKVNEPSIRAWLNDQNISYQYTNKLNLSRDLDTAMFNFSTGLPGLYQGLKGSEHSAINRQLGEEKIQINLSNGSYTETESLAENAASTVYVFFDSNTDKLFYRTEALLIGFEPISDKEQVFQPQNIVASYLSDVLACHDYVKLNLVDQRINSVSSESIFTNFNQGYFNIVYKDKTMLFQNGNLLSISAFSNGKPLNEKPDLFVVEKAIAQVTQKRIMASKQQN